MPLLNLKTGIQYNSKKWTSICSLWKCLLLLHWMYTMTTTNTPQSNTASRTPATIPATAATGIVEESSWLLGPGTGPGVVGGVRVRVDDVLVFVNDVVVF